MARTLPSPPPLRLRGARTHNLRGLDLDLPTSGLTVLVGPSGSGKSSLALDTVHAEARRRVALAVGLPPPPRPAVDHVEGLPLTVAVTDQVRPPESSRVAEVAEILTGLSALASAHGVVHCPDCGRPLPCRRQAGIVAELLALEPGTRLSLLAPLARARVGGLAPLVEEIARQGFVRLRLDRQVHRIEELPRIDARLPHDLDLVVDRIRVEPDRRERLEEAVATTLAAGNGRLVALVGKEEAERAWSEQPWCPDHPRPLRHPGAAALARPDAAELLEAQHLRLPDGTAWRQLLQAPLDRLPEILAALPDGAAHAALRADLQARLALLARLGLGHLPLDRTMGALASSERSRLVLARALTIELQGHLLVLDEPVAGLDADAARRVVEEIDRAVLGGTGALVVDHRREILARADRVLAFGPGAGRAGGAVVWQGPAEELPDALLPELAEPAAAPPPREGLRLRGASGANLQGVDLEVPPGRLTVVTGPGGSGKTALVMGTLVPALRARLGLEGPPPLPHDGLDEVRGIERLLVVDRRPLGRRHPASNVATVLGLWTPLRQVLARTREARILGVDAADLRLDRDGGRCPACQGSGREQRLVDGREEDLGSCSLCDGARFQAPTRDLRLKGRTPAELLELDLSEAAGLFSAIPTLAPPLLAAAVVGLGYLPLGLQSSSLSGGEAQRLRLARELARAGGVGASRPQARDAAGLLVVLDGPTVGLHPGDVPPVVEVLRRLAEQGAAVLAITGDPQLRAAADHEVRLGPGAGPAGGRRLA